MTRASEGTGREHRSEGRGFLGMQTAGRLNADVPVYSSSNKQRTVLVSNRNVFGRGNLLSDFFVVNPTLSSLWDR